MKKSILFLVLLLAIITSNRAFAATVVSSASGSGATQADACNAALSIAVGNEPYQASMNAGTVSNKYCSQCSLGSGYLPWTCMGYVNWQY